MDHLFFKQWKRFLAASFLCLYAAMFLTSYVHPAYAEAAAVAAAVEVAATAQDALAGGEAVQTAVAEAAVSFQQSLVYLIGLVAGALGAGATWLVNKVFGPKGKIPLPQESRAAVENAIQAGIKFAADYLKQSASGMPDWQARSVTIARVASFVSASAPSALSALGITEAGLEKMIRERLDDRETSDV